MATDEGTVLLVLRFPQPWPLSARRLILSKADEGAAGVAIFAEANGALTLEVERETLGQLRWSSQPLTISGTGDVVLAAVWGSSRTGLYINNHQLQSESAASGKPFLVETANHATGRDGPAWADPDAEQACKDWTDWRAERFSKPNSVRDKRRSKTLDEQLKELTTAARALADFGRLIQAGHDHLLGYVATELRALVYWQGRSYNPLLLRLAGRRRLPLPLYARPERGEAPPTPQPSLDIRRSEPSIVKANARHVLVDLQEWLSTVAITERQSVNGKVALAESTVIEVIADVADALGVAHYDEDAPTAVDTLKAIQSWNGREIVVLLLSAVEVVVPLCGFVINESRRPGKGSPS